MRPSEVAEYVVASAAVEGWFFPVDAHVFAVIDDIQRGQSIGGNLFEIGVHHGKTAMFLARMAGESESVGVCDVFEQQDLNVDRSGEGSRELFLRNMRGYESRLQVFSKSSHDLTAADTTTRCRFFHIDGGHRPEDVAGDLATADRALHDRGVVAVDDVFNANWPGVSEGFYRFMERGAFVPVVIGGNKVILARPGSFDLYRRAWRDPVVPGYRWEDKEWMGRSVRTAIRIAWVDLDPEGAARLHRG